MNNQHYKTRILRELKNGKKSSITETTFKQYNWTTDEKEFLKKYINFKKPFDIQNKVRETEFVSKFEIYSILEKYVDNQTTLKIYKSKVNSLLSLMSIDDENFSSVLKNVNLLISKITTKYKDPTSYFAFLLYILGKCSKLYDSIKKQEYDVIKHHFDNHKKAQTVKQLNERNSDIQYEKVYNHIFDIEKRFNKDEYASMKHIISLMYTRALYDQQGIIHMNPRNYFVKVKLVQIDSEMNQAENFYNYNTGRLIINDYKTAGIYEPYNIILNEEVKKIIYDSITTYPREFLIEKSNGGIYAGNSLSEMIQRTLNYSIDTIRKSIESYEINIKKVSREHLANVSRHTIITQTVSYLANT
jgi:hypothetical protein